MPQFLSNLISLLPIVVPGIVGLVLGVMFKRRAGKPAILVLIASSLLLVQAAFQLFSILVLFPLSGNGGLSWETYSIISSAVYFVLGSATAGLFLAAAFVDRAPADSNPPATEHGDAAAEPHRGTLVLVLGLIGMLVFSPLGIVAWVLGVQELRAMDRGAADKIGLEKLAKEL